MATRETLAEEIANWREQPCKYPAARFDGRGIVICAGGSRYFTNAWVLIWVLKRVLKTALPVQVWHLGRAEMSEGMRLMLREEGVEVVDADKVLAGHPARVAGGWPLKPYAIAHSRFREVAYLDADTIPFADPAGIFDWSRYSDTGALFWPDVVDIRDTNPIWEILGLEPKTCTSLETGILAIDKSRTWQALQLTIVLNENWDWLYDVLYGDKDTFLAAWTVLNLEFGLIPHHPIETGGAFLQRDPQGDIILEHRTQSKLLLDGENIPVSDEAMNSACGEALAQLRRGWDGTVFHAPERSEAARDLELRLGAIGSYQYAGRGGGVCDIELKAGNRVGASDGGMFKHWAVVDHDGSLALELYAATRAAVRLHADESGAWRGQSLSGPPYDAVLTVTGGFPLREMDPEAEHRREAVRIVAGLLDTSLMGAGYDHAMAEELNAACRWAARVNPHVAQALKLGLDERAHRVPGRWLKGLRAASTEILKAEEQRAANGERASIPIPYIDPDHYERQL